MRRVLIVDDSEILIDYFTRSCFADDQVFSCPDGLQAIEMLSECKPDLLVINLSLAYMDGLAVLRQAEFLPKTVIAISYVSNPHLLRVLGALGVRHTLYMPTPKALRQALEAEKNMVPRVRTDLRSQVLHHLHRLGIPTNLDGYQILTVGLPLYMRDPGQTLSKELYPAIVCAMGRGSNQTVERSIRQAIRAGWKHRDDSVWREYFTPGDGDVIPCPNNKKFLTALMTQLQQEQEP